MKPWALLLVALLGFFSASRGYADGIDDLIRDEMELRKIPGLALGITHKGKEIRREYGFANLEHNVPVKGETAFEIGNINGQFTAAAIMILVEDGRLSLDDPITRYLPTAPDAWNKVTVMHLLHGTSGLWNYALQPGFEVTKQLSEAQFIDLLAANPPVNAPGEKAEYTITDYALLGLIVENVAKQNFWVFVADRIFSPLGMTASGNRDARMIIPNRASGYTQRRNGGWHNRDSDLTEMWAAGSMISTVGDLLKWDASLNTEKILKKSSRDLMWTPGKLNGDKPHPYGFGCRVETLHGYIHILHTGSTGGFSSCYSRFPEPGVTIVVLSNGGELTGTIPIARAVATVYLADK